MNQTPYTLCKQYADKNIDRATLVTALITWDYVPHDITISHEDTLQVDKSGTWTEVLQARRDGLIDGYIYDEVYAAVMV